MSDEIVVRIEISGADFQKDCPVDPSRPLMELLQKVAEDEGIPLRKKSGHPLRWSAEGPDVRPGKEGEWAELTRTQPLTRISKVLLEKLGNRQPLFSIRFDIPGAADSLNARREVEKREEIAARMEQRAAERDAAVAAERAEVVANMGDAEEMVMDMGQSMVMDMDMDMEEPATERMDGPDGGPTILDPEFKRKVAAGAAVAGGAAIVGALALGAAAKTAGRAAGGAARQAGQAAGGAAREAGTAAGSAARSARDGLEGRRRRRGGGGAGGGSGADAGAGGDDDVLRVDEPAAGGGASAGGAAGGGARRGKGGRARATGEAKATGTGAAKKARGTGTAKKLKDGGKSKKKPTGLMAPGPGGIPLWGFAAGAGGLLLLLVILGIALSSKPEPTPEPTPAPEPSDLEDIAIATPPPPEATPEPVEEVTPPPMETFYNRAKFDHHQASAVSAQLTSFAKTNVRIVYTVTHDSPALNHALTFQGRFTLQLSDGGGSVAGNGFKANLEPGKPTRVDLRYDGTRLTVRVGGKRAGSWKIADPGGFPKWKFALDAGVRVTGLAASAEVTE